MAPAHLVRALYLGGCPIRRWLLLGVAVAVLAAPGSALAASTDWPQYLYGPQHGSVSPATAITVANAGSITQLWHFSPAAVSGKPAPTLFASPAVVGGTVFIGSGSGLFYALDAATGSILWQRALDTQPAGTCAARGITSTAAVVTDPASGNLTVYAAGARNLYALDPATGAVIWKRRVGPANPSGVNGYYNWSSPTVVNGNIYMGLASGCDTPLIRGGVVDLDQHTGTVLHTWHSVPAGSIGASVWSSVAASADGQDVWVSTGNECDPTVNTCPTGDSVGRSNSIVHLTGALSRLGAWQVPGSLGSGQDSDFGASPVLFGSGAAPPDVGACNKNGVFYALQASPLGNAPVWDDQLGAVAGKGSSCIAAAVWSSDLGALLLSGDATTIAGSSYGGSLRSVDPADGSVIWQTGLPCSVMGTPSMDAAGVVAVATYSGCVPSTAKNAAYLLDSTTGEILNTLAGGSSFAQPVFADSDLYIATASNGLYAYQP